MYGVFHLNKMKKTIKVQNKSKIKKIRNFSFILFCTISTFYFIFLIGNSFNEISKNISTNLHIMQTNNVNKTPTIIIDAGHGGEDGGASINPDIFEKDINLKIAQNLKFLFTLSGFNVTMTRESDISLSDNLKTVRERKVSDIKNRLKIIQQNPGCVFISIHQNKFSQSQYYGTQIFYSTKNESSKLLAESIKSSVVNLLQPKNERETKPTDKNIYLLDKTTEVAVLVECGFLSNPEELQKLNDESYQKKLSFAIFTGFIDYWNKENNL